MKFLCMKVCFLVFLQRMLGSDAWVTPVSTITQRTRKLPPPAWIRDFQFQRNECNSHLVHGSTDPNSEWSDFDDLGYSSSETEFSSSSSLSQEQISSFQQQLQERSKTDLTAIRTRQFRLGRDLILSDYVGNMGFDEVTDWQYYYPDDEDDERQVVQPNPLDPSKPRRTRTSSGSVIRIFRGEFVGTLGGTLSAQGLDRRLLVREFTGKLALSLARAELESLSRLQSDVMTKVDDQCRDGTWIPTAASRSVKLREDNANVAKLLKTLASTSTSTSNEQSVPFLGILGEVDLTDILEDMSPNEFYRALGVPPPNADAVWLVYEYAGLSTVQAYAVPPIIRRANLPMRKGLFGNVIEPPPLPPWKERARYVRAIMKGAILAVAQMHESGIVHRSIGRTSIIISTKAMDKREAISPLNTMTSTLRIKLADFGFSGLLTESTQNEEFCTRARSFGLRFRKGDNNISTANFAIAEDMHALGFVFLGLLLTSLAELPDAKYQIPATDEDSLQRLVGEIFDNEFVEFREYVDAEDIWSNLVEWLDENDKAGWRVLETLLLAREKAGKNQDTTQLFTVRGLLANPFFRS